MGTQLEPWWALIDMNSYFATLEQQANPYLRGKPIAVVKETGRTCVIAASKEAKLLGVKTGERLREVRIKAPQIIVVPADFNRYFHNTKLLHTIFTELSPDVDLFSLDEAFIDLRACRQLYQDSQHFFSVCRAKIQQALGTWVTFSVGFGQNRLQAKLAAEFAQKDNYFQITPENLASVLSQAQVSDICGIGYRLTEHLHRLGIEHPYQLNFYDDEFLHQHFGRFWAPELRKMGKGEENHFLTLRAKEPEHMKSVSRSKTLFVPTNDYQYLEQMIYNLTEDMCFKARRMKLSGKIIFLSMRDTRGGHWGRALQLKGRHVSLTADVFSLLLLHFHEFTLDWKKNDFPPKIIKVGVALGGLEQNNLLPTSWLPETFRQSQSTAAVDQVNEKHGLYTVTSGKLLNFKIIKPEVTGFLGDRTYQMEFAG